MRFSFSLARSFVGALSACALSLLLGDTAAQAATYTVTNTNDSGTGSLRAAITSANATTASDTIAFNSTFNTQKTITLTTGQLNVANSSTLTINGPSVGVVISGNNTSRVFFIDYSANVTLNRLVISGGNSNVPGGGIRNFEGRLSLSNCTVSNNRTASSAQGGGIFNESGVLTLTNCSVSNNTSGGGGGIYNQGDDFYGNGTVTMLDCTLSGNSAGGGGAIFNDSDAGGDEAYSRVTLTRCTLSGNSANYGGAIYNASDNHSTVRSAGSGGGISEINLTNTTLSSNSASTGGAIYNTVGNGTEYYSDYDPSSGDHSYSYHFGQSKVTLTNATIVDSSAFDKGGDIHNQISYGYSDGYDYEGQGELVAVNSLFAHNTPTSYYEYAGANGDLDKNYCFPSFYEAGIDLDGLKNNGGAVQTIALLANSPVKNVGLDTTQSPYNLSTDARGIGFPRKGSSGVDVGAFELQEETPSLVVTTADDVVDALDYQTSLREAIAYANTLASNDTITFDSSFNTQKTITLTNGLLTLAHNGTLTITAPSVGVIISGNYASSVLAINGANVTLNYLTITQSTGDSVRNAPNSRVFFNNCTITQGMEYAVFSDYSVGVRMTNCVVSYNGKGVYCTDNSWLEMTGCQILGNADAGVYNYSVDDTARIDLVNCEISGNTTGVDNLADCYLSSNGGRYYGTALLTLTGCVISGNTLQGIFNKGNSIRDREDFVFHGISSVKLTNCTVSNNSGGGIYNYNSGGALLDKGATTAELQNCTLSGNDAGWWYGGGVYNGEGTVTLKNCTLASNTASSGGAIYNMTDRTDNGVFLTNVTVANNSAPSAGAIFDYSTGVVAKNTFFVSNGSSSFFSGGPGGFTDPGPSGDANKNYSFTSRTSAGLDPDGLKNNGGPVQTIALLGHSPVKDKGLDTTQSPDNLSTDARGAGYPRKRGAGVDVGAFEVQVEIEMPSLVVTTAFDVVNNSDNLTSLREAVTYANSLTSNDTITFDSSFNTQKTIALNTAALTVANNGSLTITAPAVGVILSGNFTSGVSRVLAVQSGANVALNRLTITGGNDGGITNSGTLSLSNCTVSGNSAPGSAGSYAALGGGIANLGTLTLTDCIVSGNTAGGWSGEDVGGGAGIYTSGTLTMTNSTVANNSTSASSGNGAGILQAGGTMSLSNCTLSGNTATYLGNKGGLGGAIATIPSGTLTLVNCTVTSNSGPYGGGALYLPSATKTIVNTLFAANGAAPFNGFGTPGTNGDTNKNFTFSTLSAAGLDADGLKNNGGSVQTIALLPASFVKDKGSNTTQAPYNLSTDARGTGYPRIRGVGVDVGSFEIQAVNNAPVLNDATYSGTQGVAFSQQLAATDADGNTLSYSLVSGSTLPTGLTLSSTGLVSGTPTQSGQLIATIKVVDGQGGEDTAQITFNIAPSVGSELIVDNLESDKVLLTGAWTASTTGSGIYASNFIHDGNTGKGTKSARFTPVFPSGGSYQVYARWVSNSNRSAAAPITIAHTGGSNTVTVDQRSQGGVWVLLGTYSFAIGSNPASGSVTISNTGTTGYVIADAVRFVPVSAPPAGPANDQVGSAIVITTTTYTNTQDTTNATSTSDPIPTNVNGFGKGVWYRYTPSTTGELVVDTLGSNFDTGLAIYTGTPGSLTEIASNDDGIGGTTSRLALAVTAGTTYYFLAGGYQATTGSLKFNLSFQPFASVSINDVSVAEGNSGTTNANFTVTLSRPSALPVSINYATANGTAVQPSDYTSTSGTLTIPAGDTTSAITVLVVGDTAVEPNETFNLNLSAPSNATINDGQGIGTITNDDSGPTPTELIVDNLESDKVLLSGAWTTSTSTSGYYASNFINDGNTGKGTKSARFTPVFSSGGSYQVYARWTSASNRASNVPVTINHSGGSSTVTVNQRSDGGVWVLLGTYSFATGSNPASGSVTISNTGTNGYVIADAVRFVPVSAPAGPANDQVANATVVNSTSYTNTQETTNATSAGDPTPSSGSSFGHGVWYRYTPSAGGELVVDTLGSNFDTILGIYTGTPGALTEVASNDDSGGNATSRLALAVTSGTTYYFLVGGYNDSFGSLKFNLSFQNFATLSINDVSVAEGNSGTSDATFTVTLSRVSSLPVSVSYATANGTAIQPGDYTSASGTLTIPAGDTTGTISVSVVGDTVVEPNETFALNLSAPSNATIADAQGVGTIVNDDSSTPATELIVDNLESDKVLLTGAWTSSNTAAGYYASDFLQDGNTGKGTKSARFTPVLTAAGTYQVYARWTQHSNRASNVPITIAHSGGSNTVTVNQRTQGGIWVLLGTYSFAAGSNPNSGSVTISNTGTNGYVIADAVRFVPAGAQGASPAAAPRAPAGSFNPSAPSS